LPWVPTSAVTSEWLQLIFIADTEGLRRFGKGSVHKTIYFPEWISVHIGLPSIEEQLEISKTVSKKLVSIERLESEIYVQEIKAGKIKQSTLAAAFFGKLVQQSEGDEPASLLLQKIKEKASTAKKKARGASKEAIKKMEVSMRRSILDVLEEEDDPIEITLLMQKAGFDVTQIEKFYYELGDIADQIKEIRPSKAAAKNWPYTETVRISLRK
jgi:hypothetical protein